MLRLLAARTMQSNSQAGLRLIEPVLLQATRWRRPQAASFDSFLIWTEGRHDKTPARLDKYSVRPILPSWPSWSWACPCATNGMGRCSAGFDELQDGQRWRCRLHTSVG